MREWKAAAPGGASVPVWDVTAYGDTPDEVAFAVLDQVRAVTGPGPRLEIIPGCPVRPVASPEECATGKAYRADVLVREIPA